MNKLTSFRFYSIALFLLALQSLNAYFLWDYYAIVITIAFVTCIPIMVNSNKYLESIKDNYLPIILFCFVKLYTLRDGNIQFILFELMHIPSIIILILLKKEFSTKVLNFLTKSFALILLISVSAWIIHSIGLEWKSKTISFEDGQYFYSNYYFFLELIDVEVFKIKRFTSIFLEPGHLGMICALLLHANKYDFKNVFVVIILMACLVTFSLAAYVLIFASMVIFSATITKKPLQSLFLIVVSILFIVYITKSINSGNNALQAYIFDRLIIENNELIGNNRFTGDFNSFYTQFLDSDRAIYGIGSQRFSEMFWEGGNAGYKVFIVQHGIIGLLLMISFYASMLIANNSTFAMGFLFLYIISFLQRSYSLWDIELIIYISAISLNAIRSSHEI